MIATATDQAGVGVGRQGLAGRILGVIVSPRATYAGVAAHPRVLGALLVVLVVISGATAIVLSTEVGQVALLDQQVRAIESFGVQVTDEMYEGLESSLRYAPYVAVVNQLALIPVAALVISGLIIAVFNAFLGGNATFKQVYAIVIHSGFLLALQALFTQPLNYVREQMSSPTTLAAFTPFLDTTSFPARLLGAIDLFLIWWIVSLAIGVGVLYRKSTAPIALALLSVYGATALLITVVLTSFSGA